MAPTSRAAAMAAACADIQGSYEAFSRSLYQRQSADGFSSDLLRNTIPSLVGMAGDELVSYQQCLDGEETGRFVDTVQRNTEEYKLAGVPGFLLDGVDVTMQLWDDSAREFSPNKLQGLLGG